MASKAQIRATNKWKRKHPARTKVYHYRSCTRSFINRMATKQDLIKVINLAEKRLKIYD